MKKSIKKMTAEVAESMSIYAMISANAYKKKKGRIRFNLKKLGWKQVDLNGKSTNNPAKVHKLSGLALSVSVRFGIKAFTFDPSPRIFDGIGNKHKPVKRVIIQKYLERKVNIEGIY